MAKVKAKKDNRMASKKKTQIVTKPPMKNAMQIIPEETLFRELSLLIEKSKQKVVSQVKSTVNLLFWQIGKRINEEILHNKRAEYGAQIVSNLAEKLSAQFGRSFEVKNLRRMMQFAEQFPNRKIVVPLARQLSWLYLKWLNRYERQADENEPIGLILCAGDSREQIELLEMDKDGIMVAEYWTELPPKKELQEKIRKLLLEARERLESRRLLEQK